ncbi:MAG: lipocalin family protein [Spirochaetaceae bacterium]|jgi:hypothetical protein|nr:lipocalin family protein [Spirochaetaceae bacterium]
MKKFFLFLSLILIFFSGCAGPEKKLLGTWKLDGKEFYFTFLNHEDLNVNNEIFMKYSITDDGKIILGEEEPVAFELKDDTITIKQEGLNITLTRVKKPEFKILTQPDF